MVHLARLITRGSESRANGHEDSPVSPGEGNEVRRKGRAGAGASHITPATKIRTNPYSRFGPATADRGSRGIRDQPRNPPKSTEKRIRINFPFPRRGHTLCRSRRTAASARRPDRSARESGGTSEPAGSSSRICKAAGYNDYVVSFATPDSNVPEPESLRSSQPPSCPRAIFIEALCETPANRRQSARSPAAAAEGRRDVGTEDGI